MAVLVGAAVSIVSWQASADTKFELGVRTGYAKPFGRVYDHEGSSSGGKITNVVVGQVPFWVDMGARIGGQLFVGGYVSYGVEVFSGDYSDMCDEADRALEAQGGNVSCSASDVRLGAQAHYHFGGPDVGIDPWIGGGLGYEWLSVSETASAGGESLEIGATAHGFEFVNLQGGLDFPVSEAVALGPFVAFSLASYRKARLICDGSICDQLDADETTNAYDDTALHEWLFFGVRAAFVF